MRNSKFWRGVALAALATTASVGAIGAANAQQAPIAVPPPAPPTTTTAWSGSPRWTDEDRQFKITGRIQYDVYNIQSDFPGTTQDLNYTQTDTRRVFLGVAGRFTDAFRYDIKLAFTPNNTALGSGNGTVGFDDAFLEYVHKDFSIVVGQNNIISPMEDRTSSLNIPFNERSSYINAFGFAKKMGLAVITNGGNWSAGAGVYGGDLGATETENADEELTFITRGTWAPYYQNTPDGLRLLHIGATARQRDNGGSGATGPNPNTNPGFRYRARPDVGFGSRLVDTGALADKDTFIGVEVAGQWDQFGFNGEYGQLTAKPNTGAPANRADRDFSGGYFDLFWSPTGESRTYNAADGSFGKPRIRRTLGSDGGIGHVMLGARYEYLDLVDGPTPAIQTVGGKQQSYVGQITWMPITYVKFQLDYAKEDITRTGAVTLFGSAATAQGNADVITFRTQLDW